MNLLKKLWRDEVGLVVSAETVMVGTLGVIGAVAGISTAASSVNSEMLQMSQAFRGFNQSYSVTGTTVSMGSGPVGSRSTSSGAGGFQVTTGAHGFQQVNPLVDMQAAQVQYVQAASATAQAFGVQSDVCGQTTVQPQQIGVVEEVVVVPQTQTIPARQY